MYAEPEVLIKLSAIEIQQALAIELDRDSSQALQFMKEKIVDKYFRAPCKLSSLSINGAAPRKLRRCSSSCCLSGYRAKR
jgi:hypothetical protein